MNLLEKELEDFIFKDLTQNSGHNLVSRGLTLPYFMHPNKPRWFRQLNLSQYGFPDIVGFYRHHGELFVDLIELKAVKITPDHVEQVLRYKKGIEVYLENSFPYTHHTIRPILIGSEYDGLYLQNDLDIIIASYTNDLMLGIYFNQHGLNSSWHIPSASENSFRKPKYNGEKVY